MIPYVFNLIFLVDASLIIVAWLHKKHTLKNIFAFFFYIFTARHSDENIISLLNLDC